MGQSQGFIVNCSGGLDLVSTSFDLAQKPGYATELINYESSTNGGYRRINGYVKVNSDNATVVGGGGA